jgi:hypothetical protein
VKRRAKPQVNVTNQFSFALKGRHKTAAQSNPEHNSISRIPFIQRFPVLLAKPAKLCLEILLFVVLSINLSRFMRFGSP